MVTPAITEKPNGSVECFVHGSDPWCRDIEEYVQEVRDAPKIWADVEPGKKIHVPYIPTQELWVICEFGEEMPGGYKFYLQLQLQNAFLGFVSPGEGRRVMREMVHNWFVPRINKTIECSSSSHGVAEHRLLKEHMRDTSMAIAEHWSIQLHEGMCLMCTKKLNSVIYGASDLVPDVSGGRRPF